MKIRIDDVRFPPDKDWHDCFPDLCKSDNLQLAVVDYMAVIGYELASRHLTPNTEC